MTRAAIIAARGDPFANMLIADSFKKVWRDEVDMLYVAVSSWLDGKVKAFLKDVVFNDPKIKLFFFDGLSQGGDHEPFLVEQGKEDNLVMLEDDVVIFKKGSIDDAFKKIETGKYDLLGQVSGAIDPFVLEKVRNIYSTETLGPAFRFFKRKDWEKTDKVYTSFSLLPGKYYKEIRSDVPSVATMDTGLWNSVQMISLKLKVLDIKEYRATEITPGCPWTHVNALTSWSNHRFFNPETMDFVGKMVDPKAKSIEFFRAEARSSGSIYGKNTASTKEWSEKEICRLMSWVTIAMRKYWDSLAPIDEYRQAYKKGYDFFIKESEAPSLLLEKYVKENGAYLTW